MSDTIVITEYVVGVEQKALPAQDWKEKANRIAVIPSLQCKYWLDGEGDGRGGVYLFSDREKAEMASIRFVQSLVASGTRDATRRLFGVDEDLSALSRNTLIGTSAST